MYYNRSTSIIQICLELIENVKEMVIIYVCRDVSIDYYYSCITESTPELVAKITFSCY